MLVRCARWLRAVLWKLMAQSELRTQIEARRDDWPALKAFLLAYTWPPLPEPVPEGDYDPGENGWDDVRFAVARGWMTRAQRDEVVQAFLDRAKATTPQR